MTDPSAASGGRPVPAGDPHRLPPAPTGSPSPPYPPAGATAPPGGAYPPPSGTPYAAPPGGAYPPSGALHPPPPGGPHGWAPGQPYAAPPGVAHPPPAPPGRLPYPPRRRGGTWLVVGALVLVVVVAFVGCVGYVFVRPQWQRQQLAQVYEQVDFQPFGFVPPIRRPQVRDSPLRVEETWATNLDLVTEPEFVDRAVERLYTWSRDRGATAPREDFAGCFASHCQISWIYRNSHTVTIIVSSDLGAIPTWDLVFILRPL